MAAVLVPRLPRRRRRPPRCRRWPFVLFVYNAQIGRHVAPLAADGRRKEEEEEVEEDDRVFSYANIGRQLSTYGSPFPFPRHCLSITMGIDRRKFTANFDQRAPPPFDVSRVIDEPRAVFFFFFYFTVLLVCESSLSCFLSSVRRPPEPRYDCSRIAPLEIEPRASR